MEACVLERPKNKINSNLYEETVKNMPKINSPLHWSIIKNFSINHYDDVSKRLRQITLDTIHNVEDC